MDGKAFNGSRSAATLLPPAFGLAGVNLHTWMPPNDHNRFYLETKALRSGHYIDFDGKEHLPEQDEPVLVGGVSRDSLE